MRASERRASSVMSTRKVSMLRPANRPWRSPISIWYSATGNSMEMRNAALARQLGCSTNMPTDATPTRAVSIKAITGTLSKGTSQVPSRPQTKPSSAKVATMQRNQALWFRVPARKKLRLNSNRMTVTTQRSANHAHTATGFANGNRPTLTSSANGTPVSVDMGVR